MYELPQPVDRYITEYLNIEEFTSAGSDKTGDLRPLE
ncbi:uncharacterized protein METZ01_LOCUS323774 [marine metagenome]|uniref:Uncharacterized protein n=1 Tax=marine metagenome TaxID=408172 RepID=A0A382PDL7_9ZZZZ